MNTATQSPVVLTATGLTKTYAQGGDHIAAVVDADISLRRGEVVALVGKSGSGKTTLLNVLAGWEAPDKGRVIWEQDPHIAPLDLPWHSVALIPQDLALTDELTIEENILLPARITSSVIYDARRRSKKLIKQLGLDGLQERLPSETSLGQQQRATVARALLLNPSVILADEPTAHQDLESAEPVFETFRQAAASGTCCVIATHDPAASVHADRMISMSDGRISASA